MKKRIFNRVDNKHIYSIGYLLYYGRIHYFINKLRKIKC